MDAFSPGTKKAGRTIGRWAKHYFFGMLTKSFNSSIIAVDGVIGLAVGAATTTEIEKPNWKAALAMFGVSFVRSCIMYFKDNPIPTELPESLSTPPPNEQKTT